ncbi:MAG: hypothetical protein H7328_13325 [Bdellovibrio sp.]|nr:hypothetical protein [Bdellovibrio sp.]
MKTTLTRNEKLLMGVILFVGVLFAALFAQVELKQKPMSQFDSPATYINYQMGRATESFSEYSLNGRDVENVYEGLSPKEASKAKQVDAKKKTDLKKKDETKKVQAAAPAAKPKPKPVAKLSAVAPSSDKKSAVESSHYTGNYTSTYGPSAPYQAPVIVNAEAEDKDKDKKTFAQWRALIFAIPTRETLAPFIEAYRKGTVTATEYQAMAQDLLDQPNEKYKGLGLYALRAQPSLQSLTQLIHLPNQGLSTALQTYANEGVLAYLQAQNISVLNQALQTKNKVLITKILTVLNANLPKINQGDYSTVVDSRNRRDSETGSLTVASFKSLVPALSALLTAGDTEVAALAQQTSGLIQSTNTIAQN